MIKNLTSNQLFLIAIAAMLLLVAAFSFFLLQDPSAPLPFVPAGGTPSLLAPTLTPALQSTETPRPTRQTSYTPFANLLTPTNLTPSSLVPSSTAAAGTTTPGATTPSSTSTRTLTPAPSNTTSLTLIPTNQTKTPTPTVTGTNEPGAISVTGRVIQNGTPVAGATVEFKDDVAPRRVVTNQGGHYAFITYAPSAAFSLTFRLADNPQLTPQAEISSLALVEGTIPTGVDTFDLPDLEISLDLEGVQFGLQSPADGAALSASAISASNPIQFSWTNNNTGGPYLVELGLSGSAQPVWTSSQLSEPGYRWDGTLTDGTHIIEGNYWWRVGAVKTVNGYLISVFTHQWDLAFNP